jgi:hypothetical protein
MNEPDTTVSLTDEWELAHFYKMPGNLTGDEMLEVRLMTGVVPMPRLAKDWYWDHCDIVAYRIIDKPNGASAPRAAAKS